MKASTLCFRAAVVLVVIGMLWGLQMAISGDHSAHPAHAHLNLLGWVCLFLFGIYYRLHPALEGNGFARIQVWLWIVGTVIQAIGVGLVHTGSPKAEPAAAGGSILVLVAMLMFGWLVYREADGAVWVAYTDFDWIARRHGVSTRDAQFHMATAVAAWHVRNKSEHCVNTTFHCVREPMNQVLQLLLQPELAIAPVPVVPLPAP